MLGGREFVGVGGCNFRKPKTGGRKVRFVGLPSGMLALSYTHTHFRAMFAQRLSLQASGFGTTTQAEKQQENSIDTCRGNL